MDSVVVNLMEQMNVSSKEVEDMKSSYEGPVGAKLVKPTTISNIVLRVEQLDSEIKALKSPYIKIGGEPKTPGRAHA